MSVEKTTWDSRSLQSATMTASERQASCASDTVAIPVTDKNDFMTNHFAAIFSISAKDNLCCYEARDIKLVGLVL